MSSISRRYDYFACSGRIFLTLFLWFNFFSLQRYAYSLSSTPRQSEVYLLSLREVDASGKNSYSQVTRDVWKWKDRVLGDGRDFFVPRPKTLQRLQQVLPFESVSILSNCARFEIFVVLGAENDHVVDDRPPQQLVAAHLVHQMKFHQQQYGTSLSPPIDWPRAISLDPCGEQESLLVNAESVTELCNHFQVIQGVANVTRHLCLVSTGLASRPVRPNRPAAFRPFSSRDAHIMLQLKRTLELIDTSSDLLMTIFRCALRAGKMARTLGPEGLPEIQALRPYGTGNSKYDTAEPPSHLMEAAVKAVHEKIIEPLVEKCVCDFESRLQRDRIISFREKAQHLAHNDAELDYIKKHIHKATLSLRSRPEAVDDDKEIRYIEGLLQAYRTK